MYYEIVPMAREHIPQIARLEQVCFSAPWSETMLEEALFDPQASFLVAEDEEGGVVAACDAVVAPGTAGPVGMELILRGVDAVDESYPILMKALWSGKE